MIHTDIIKRQWYNNSDVFYLFIHLAYNAKIKPENFRNITIEKGQLLTSRKKLSNKTGISEQTIRTCLKRLINSGDISIKTNNQYSLITVKHGN